MQAPVTRSFTTGDLIETSTFTADVYTGNYSSAATNIPIRVMFNRPVSAASVDAGTILFNKASAIASSYYWIPVKATFEIAADSRMVTVVPAEPLVGRWP